MKKYFLLALAAILGLCASAKTADELRVYINPGHGSWTANDRPMAIRGHGKHTRYNTDTLSFFESNTNLRKGFGVLEELRASGLKFDPTLNQTGDRHQIGAARDMSNNIVMSHVKCGPYHDDNGTKAQLTADGKPIPEDFEYYNRSLSEICMEVDANNFDMFISIHSNALTSDGKWYTTNFPIILYRGYDDCRTEDGLTAGFSQTCKDMAQKVWPYHMKNIHEGWTAYSVTNPNIRGDINFYGKGEINRGYKGYLGVLKHGTPGFLVEGYFHQYAPAALRHMNWDVDYVEGINYAHGIADYFGINKSDKGTVYGIVRDAHERFRDETYVPLPNHSDAYKPIDGVKVTLLKGTETVAEYTTDNQFNGAFVFYNVEPGDYTLTFEAEGYRTPEPLAVTVAAAEVSYPEGFMESESYIPPTVHYYDYPDELAGTSYGAREEYAFEQQIVDKEIESLAGTTIRRMLAVGKYIYVLAHNAEDVPLIVVLDATTLEVVATPEVTGTEGTGSLLADIAVSADGVLICTPEELCHFDDGQVAAGETRGELNIYRWTNNDAGLPEGAPQPWLTTKLSGNFYRAVSGSTIAYSGTMAEGRLVISADNASATSGKVFYSFIDVVDGTKASEGISNNSYLDHRADGPYTLNVSPLNSDNMITDAATLQPMEIDINGKVLVAAMPAGIIDAAAAMPGFFRYAGHAYMVASDATAEGNAGVVLVDITDGLANAAVVPTANTTLEAGSANAATVGMTIIHRDAYEEITGGDIALFVLRGNKISRFTTEGVRQPQPRREYAYGITLNENDSNDGTYTVTFQATGAAPAADIVLTPTDATDSEPVRIPVGAVVKGENTVTFSKADLPGNLYTFGVAITNRNIPASGEFYADANNMAKRGGVVTITDPESDNLGYTLVTTGGANGVKVYAPDGTVTGPFLVNDSRLQASNQSSMFRGDERNGMAVFADWSDGGAGYWIVDPRNPEDMSQLLAGERSGNAGSYAYNGTIIGGGSSCVAFQGTGENTKMFSFLEDYPAGNTPGSQNRVYRYDIGNDAQITRVPEKAYDNLTGGSILANQNVEIATTADGFFAAQVRGEGNNLSGTPGFAYVTNEGELLFQSSDLEYITSCSSGIAVNRTGKLFAVGQYSCITIMSLDFNEYGEPEFTKIDNIAITTSDWSHMRFDAGDNLHVYLRQDNGYHAYSIVGNAPETFVPAKAAYVVIGSNSGVEDVVVEEEADAQAIYYNLSGIRVDGELTPGVYIKVAGSKASKVVIR